MGESVDPVQRSSSPLKRRASSMEPEGDITEAQEDVYMMGVDAAEAGEPEPGIGPKKNAGNAVSGQMDGAGRGTEAASSSSNAPDAPPFAEQLKTIHNLVEEFRGASLQKGQEVYLVSRQWLSRAQAFGADAKHLVKDTSAPSPGPVDNSDIIQAIFEDATGKTCVKLKPGMGLEDFEPFPKAAWDLLLSWYGIVEGQIPIVRTAHDTTFSAGESANVQIEYHPPLFIIHRLWSCVSTLPIEQEIKQKKPPPPVIMHSSSHPFMDFFREAKKHTGIPVDRNVRMWRILQTIPASDDDPSSGIKTPPDSPNRLAASRIRTDAPIPPGSWPEMLLDNETFMRLEKNVGRALVEGKDQTANPKYNGSMTLGHHNLMVDQTLVLDESIMPPDSFVSNFFGGAQEGSEDRTATSKGNSGKLAAPTRGTGSGRVSPAPQGIMTRGRAQYKSGRVIGTTGLQNLGNTCYMNSALQCVRSVEELTKYFLTHEAAKEINSDNPLSHNGEVATAYSKLLDEIYKTPPPPSVAPRHFKTVIGRYAPSFSGYGQQDSQEFLGFLLDGLQEDLSRVKKKPYIEKPDSTDDMINNPAAIREMAEKVWDITKKRDDSVIADLFTGMYQSTLVCPQCDKISITFDPFNNLTLPLPVANVWNRTVKYFPLNDSPVEISVDIDKTSSMKALKQFISARVGVPVERLFGAEEFRDKFFKYYLDDFATVSEEIQNSDHPTMFELEAPPTNVAERKDKAKKKPAYRSMLDNEEPADVVPSWDDPVAARLLVPVVHRLIGPEDGGGNRRRLNRSRQEGELPPPHFIVLTPEEARSEDMIRRKILEKIATFTTWPELALADDSDTEEPMDQELVNPSDADSSGDTKVTAKSVEGEEDIVDVSMSDAADSRKARTCNNTASRAYPLLLKKFRNKRPKWLDTQQFLAPHFQNLFEIGFFRDPGSLIPTGWQNVQEDSSFPRLSTRQRKAAASDVEMCSPGGWEGSEESGSEEASPSQHSSVTRMMEESSDEGGEEFRPVSEMLMPPRSVVRRSGSGGRGGKKKVSGGKTTYGKKGKKRQERQQRERAAQRQQQQESMEPDADDAGYDGGPLVRPGEGLVVDWNETAWASLFDGNSPVGRSGMKTYSDVPTLEDVGLLERTKQRSYRKKHGISLNDCLDEFEKEEILSEQDTWYCPRCKEHRRASKKFDLWKTPDILVVHLKRFSSSGYRRDKLDILVDFPVEELDLTHRVIDKVSGKEEIYDLFAVDDHWGGLGGGHYTAFAKNFINDTWYEYNDTSVSKVDDPSRVVSSGAYLLFYRRRSDVPLGGPRFQEILDRWNSEFGGDDNTADSGEEGRLGQGSSLRGSPSASTGAGLILHQAKGGLASTQSESTLTSGTLDNAEGSAASRPFPLYLGDGAPHWTGGDGDTVRNSIELDDEAIDLPAYGNAAASMPLKLNTSQWTFQPLGAAGAGTGSEATAGGGDDDDDDDDDVDGDIASDAARNDGGSEAGREFAADGGFDDESGSADAIDLVEAPPPPGADEQDAMRGLTSHIWENKANRVLEVPNDMGLDQASDKVVDIHVGDADEQDAPDAGAHDVMPSVEDGVA